MNLAWHITRKDLRRLTGPLVGFGLVELLKILIGLALRAGDGVDMAWFSRMELYLNLARGAEALMTFLLVGLLVHEDAWVGIHVFWRTRPISNGLLLRSKLLTGVLIFGVLPTLIAVPWWLVCGLGIGDMVGASLEMLGWIAVVVVPASALALISDNLGRYISMAVIGYALGAFSLLMGIAYLPGSEPTNWGVLQSRGLISLGLILAGWIAVVIWQLRRRSVGVPSAVLVFLVVAIPQVMWSWPMDILAPWRPRQYDSSAATREIQLIAGRAHVDYADGVATSLDTKLRVDQLPEDRVFTAGGADLTWHARSGSHYATGFSLYGFSGNNWVIRTLLGVADVPPDPETKRWQREKLLEQRKRWSASQEHDFPPLSPDQSRKMVALHFGLAGTAKFEPPTINSEPELRMDVVMGRPQKLGELPIEPSAWQTMGGCKVRITRVEKKLHPAAADGSATAFAETNFNFIATDPDGEWFSPLWRLLRLGSPKVLPVNCWLVSRELGVAYNSGAIGVYNPTVRIDGVQVAWRSANVAEPRVIRNGIWTGYVPDWDKKFALVFVGYSLEGEFRRTIRLEQIKQNRKQPEQTVEANP